MLCGISLVPEKKARNMPIKVERFTDLGVGERIALKEGRSWITLTDQESRDLIKALLLTVS